MIKVFVPDTESEKDIINLWSICFGDSEDYIKFFLKNCPDFVCIGYFSDNRLISMLFLLEGEINNQKCKYLYAACTDPEYRKQGLMSELLEFTKIYCQELNYSAIFLVPANESLYNYYTNHGYIPSFRKSYIKIKNSDKEPSLAVDIIDVSTICKIKSRLMQVTDGFNFNNETIIYTIKEHFYNGGKAMLYESEEGSCLSFYYISGKDLIVKELLCDFDISLSMFKEVFSNKNVENIYIYTPIVYNNKDIGEEYTKCGMCLPLNDDINDYLKENTDLYAGMYLD